MGDYVFHPQTGEQYRIPQVCRECKSENLAHYTPDGDFLPLDGWRQCEDCQSICAPIPPDALCPACEGSGGSFVYAYGIGTYTQDCEACHGTGWRTTKRPELQTDQEAANAAVPHAEPDANDLAYQEYCERVEAEQAYMEEHDIDPDDDRAGWYADFERLYYGEE